MVEVEHALLVAFTVLLKLLRTSSQRSRAAIATDLVSPRSMAERREPVSDRFAVPRIGSSILSESRSGILGFNRGGLPDGVSLLSLRRHGPVLGPRYAHRPRNVRAADRSYVFLTRLLVLGSLDAEWPEAPAWVTGWISPDREGATGDQ